MVQSEAGVIRKSRGQLKSPLLVPSGLRKTVHSSMWPKGWNRRLTSSSPCCLPSIPTNSFRSSGDKSRSHLGTLSPLGLCRGTEEPRKGANHGLALGRRGGNEKALTHWAHKVGFFLRGRMTFRWIWRKGTQDFHQENPSPGKTPTHGCSCGKLLSPYFLVE